MGADLESVFFSTIRKSPRKLGLVRFFFLLLLSFISAASMPAAGQAASPSTEIKGTEAVIHALCGKRIALLGESPVHGFGETLEFKAELVRRLVDGCHYNALFIESGIYDFIHIEKTVKSGQDATEAMISAAIGGIWANQEVRSLVPFLREKVAAGSLILGGLDDQIGAVTYASHDMASDLAQYLQGDERSRCLGILQRHLLYQYTRDAPYSPADREKIVGCLNEIEGRASHAAEGKEPWAEADKAMIESFKRSLARDFTEDDINWWNGRDQSMYLNFQWLFSRLPPHSKVIVWAATVHGAKDLSGINGFEGKAPFGAYLRRDFGDQSFSLGFSAYSGDYAFVRQPVRQLSAAPASSLEGQAFAHGDSDIAFLSRNQLRKYGSVAARPLGTSFTTAHWDKVVDGLVIFRKEHAPAWLNR